MHDFGSFPLLVMKTKNSRFSDRYYAQCNENGDIVQILITNDGHIPPDIKYIHHEIPDNVIDDVLYKKVDTETGAFIDRDDLTAEEVFIKDLTKEKVIEALGDDTKLAALKSEAKDAKVIIKKMEVIK